MFYKDKNITGNVAQPGANPQVGRHGPFLHFPYSSSLPLSKRTRDSPDWSEFHLLGSSQVTAEKYRHLVSISVRLVFQLTSYSWEKMRERRRCWQRTGNGVCAGILWLYFNFSSITPHHNMSCVERFLRMLLWPCEPKEAVLAQPFTFTHTGSSDRPEKITELSTVKSLTIDQNKSKRTKKHTKPAGRTSAANVLEHTHMCVFLYSHMSSYSFYVSLTVFYACISLSALAAFYGKCLHFAYVI